MLLYVFCIAILNVCLGFAVAVHLARRHRALVDAVMQPRRQVVHDAGHVSASAPRSAPGSSAVKPAAAGVEPAEVAAPQVEPTTVRDESDAPAPAEAGDQVEAPVLDGPSAESAVAADDLERDLGLETTDPDMSDERSELESVPIASSEQRAASDHSAPTDRLAASAHAPASARRATSDRAGPPSAATGAAVEQTEAGEGSQATGGDDLAERHPAGDVPLAGPVESESNELAADAAAQPEGEPASDAVTQPEGRLVPDAEGEPALENALARWQAEVSRYYEELSQVRDGLRECRVALEPARLEGCLTRLRTAGEDYLSSAKPARDVVSRRWADQGAAERARSRLQEVSSDHDALIEDTHRAIVAFDHQGDLGAGCDTMARRTDQLLGMNRKVQDALAAAGSAGATVSVRPEAAETDEAPLAELTSAEDMHTQLAQWWEDNADRTHQLSAIMLAVDKYDQICSRHGALLGNRILRAIANLLAAERRGEGLTVQLDNQRFVCVYYEADRRFADAAAERLRQTIEHARFCSKKDEIAVTLSCGVTEATAQDTTETLLLRAEQALTLAERHGGNKTCSHSGTFPDVLPPKKLDVRLRRIEL